MWSARLPRSAPWRCLGRSVADARVEPLVWNYVRELLADREVLRARYAEGRGDSPIDERDERERLRLGRKLQALDGEVQRLIDAYQARVIDHRELQIRRRRVEDHGTTLRARLREITEHHESREQQLRLVQGLDEFCARMRTALICSLAEHSASNAMRGTAQAISTRIGKLCNHPVDVRLFAEVEALRIIRNKIVHEDQAVTVEKDEIGCFFLCRERLQRRFEGRECQS